MPDGADLHVHTACSDGTDPPALVVAQAAQVGLAALAICDHDTLAGVAEVLAPSPSQGEGRVRVLPGVELTAERAGAETHIVGLFVDPANVALLAALETKRRERRARLPLMAERLAELGKTVDLQAVLEQVGRENPSRTHLAEALRRAGYVSTIQEAFNRLIGEDKPAYVPRPRFSVPEACALIRGAGGLAVLAHPQTLKREDLEAMAADGIQAIEAYNPTFADGWGRTLRRWARALDLGVSGGSDYHGRLRPDSPLGGTRLPLRFLEDLLRRAGKT